MMLGVLIDLRLKNFRCFDFLEFHPGGNRTFIVGSNAQGKTSILEAVCFLLRLQSPRTSAPLEAAKFGHDDFSLDGHWNDSHLSCHYTAVNREISLDSKLQSRTDDYLDMARVTWFANTDLELVRGGSAFRRRYIDFLGTQCLHGYRKSLRAYERALRSRNALLKEGRPYREVSAFDEPLIEAGEYLLAHRAMLISQLAPLASASCNEISGSSDLLEMAYRPGCVSPFREALAASQAEEKRLRQTIIGPHRDDFLLNINGQSASDFSSEGQQRGIALALKIAQARHLNAVLGRPPLLLLDDVFGELDPIRRNRLLASLPAVAQSIITTTFLEWADDVKNDTVFDLADSKLISRLHA